MRNEDAIRGSLDAVKAGRGDGRSVRRTAFLSLAQSLFGAVFLIQRVAVFVAIILGQSKGFH